MNLSAKAGEAADQPGDCRDQLSRMIAGFWTTQAVSVAVQLRLPDFIAEQAQAADELAVKTGTHARSLYRLLRALSSSGIFHEDEHRCFHSTPMSDVLRQETRDSMAGLALMRGGWQYTAWGELLHGLQTGETPFQHVFGKPLFEHLGEHPEHAAIFDQAMVGVHGRETAAMLTALDWSACGTLADIGGGNGSVLAAILRRCPNVTAIHFDRADVSERAGRLLEEAGVADRCRFVSGDFFDSLPDGADTLLLRHILHDWSDELALRILRNCERSMTSGSRLLIAEYVLPDGPEPFHGKWFDLAMMVVTGGQERTESEYVRLLESAGFRWLRVIPTTTDLSIIEAVKP